MRSPEKHVAQDGTITWRIRYRHGGKETSETFRRQKDALMFSGLLAGGGIGAAQGWLNAAEARDTAILFGDWFEEYVDQLTGVSPRTRNDYRSMHGRYLTHLDQMPLSLITRNHITTLVNEMDRAGRAPKTIKQTVHLLSTCLRLAIREGHLVKNPCEGIRLPRAGLGGTEARFLTPDEAGDLIAATPEHYKALVAFLFGTGLRWSEATALLGRHVNLTEGTVRVEQAWKRNPTGPFTLGAPKTSKSRRTVNAGVAGLVAIAPLVRGPNDLIFLTKSGGPVRHANFYTNVWKPTVTKLEFVPPPRIHDARHSHASWLISAGQSLEAVQDQLGHQSILTTRGVYGHLQPALGRDVGLAASSIMQQVLAGRHEPLELEA